MITPNEWMPRFLSKLEPIFGDRLLYLGLQGSYRRGEAMEKNDIDVVTVLDALAPADLDKYRRAVRAMPEGDKACGFMCGREELTHWPRHELFQLKMDTEDYHGRLDALLPPIGRPDIEEGARIGAATLYHQIVHGYLYAKPEERSAVLAGALKAAFFTLQLSEYLRTGVYCAGKQKLFDRLEGAEKEIAAGSMDFREWLASRTVEDAFTLLLAWCRRVITRPSPSGKWK